MKTNIIAILVGITALTLLNSCVAVVDPEPTTTTRATTTTQSDPYAGTTTYRKTTTTY